MAKNRQDGLRSLPAVGAVTEAWRRRGEGERSPRLLGYLARRLVDAERAAVLGGETATAADAETLAGRLSDELRHWPSSSSSRVVNGTGIVLHSGLGRAIYPERALATAMETLRGYNLLEVDRAEGRRRKRDAHCETLLCELTGAEAALVVNNNAAATMIILSTLAAGKEVVVSRSQLIEIGGSYRLPDVFVASGCRLREVGTTNKSYARDYEQAIGEDTGALMLVHTSNYRIVGFTKHVEIEEMVGIGRRHGIPVIDDLGSGCLIDLVPHGIPDEPPVPASVKAGADVVCFSGDKLIGGPQAGIIVGRKEWIDRIRKNPLARALRVDKTTCVLLEATLKLYLEPERLFEDVPTLRMMTTPKETLDARARALVAALEPVLAGAAGRLEIIDETSELGAGTLPLTGLDTRCVALDVEGLPPQVLAGRLRRRRLPVFTRVKDDRVLIDARTLQEGDDALIAAALREILEPENDAR
ncbi:MAG: L-seryl-tRNA(Sec) selenium transferase [Planctomycetota bacterium]